MQLHTPARVAIIALVLVSTVATTACSAAAGAASPALATPVPPQALATLPPPKPAAAAPTGPAVAIENFNYVSADLTVPSGTTVVWTNHDDVEHTVTASDGSFTSASIGTEGQYSFTFSQPGTYSYFCAIHPFMTAKVTVQ